MKWSPQQAKALESVSAWLQRTDQQTFYLAGYAGTGKTTLARHLAESAGRVLYASYTGKAASVMRKNGCYAATTIHRLIYCVHEKSRVHLRELQKALEKSEGEERKQIIKEIEAEKQALRRPGWSLNPNSKVREADLVVIDECSMVDSRIGRDLESFGVPILVLGDPAQLPPVRGGGYFTDRKPDVMLTEIHRQARDNPIIDLATRIRSHKMPGEGCYGDSKVIVGKPSRELVESCDQIIVGSNKTRRSVNSHVRQLAGRGLGPEVGDKLVCLRNNHETGLLNGTTWWIVDIQHVDDRVKVGVTLRCEEGRAVDTIIHRQYFKGDEPDFYEIRDADCFDYGYALTAHKSQGSQWPRVCVFDEGWIFKSDRWKWLYTAVTRASDSVIISRRN